MDASWRSSSPSRFPRAATPASRTCVASWRTPRPRDLSPEQSRRPARAAWQWRHPQNKYLSPAALSAVREHRLGIAVLLLCTFLWSTAGVATRFSSVSNGWEAAFWRSLFLGVVIALFMLAQHGASAPRKLLAMGWAGFVSSLCWAAMFICFMLALSLTTVANALLIMGVMPLCAAVAGRLFLGEQVPMRTWFAIAAAGIGIGLMFHDALGTGNLLGSLVALAIPVAAAANNVAVKRGR